MAYFITKGLRQMPSENVSKIKLEVPEAASEQIYVYEEEESGYWQYVALSLSFNYIGS